MTSPGAPSPPSLGRRAAGVLLHPTSLPGPRGSGDLGPAARRFAEFLASAGAAWWQMLPIGPAGPGHSPYSSPSSFAGNPLLISGESLVRRGLLAAAEIIPGADRDRLLRRAAGRFGVGRRPAEREAFERFCARHAEWLEDYASFRALKKANSNRAWLDWPEGLRRREPEALRRAVKDSAGEIGFQRFLQFEFDRQWRALRRKCRDLGVGLIGDVPIYATLDSADVWAHQDLFFLDGSGRPTVVGGVPPDVFSTTGQLWGNPLYRWDRMRRDRYAWWMSRLRANLERFDAVRLDHFIGFTRYWEIAAGEKTAVGGRWVAGPGRDFFAAARDALGRAPFIAEDLGALTPEVTAVRAEFELPGMAVLQFAFGGDDIHQHRPENLSPRTVIYTGTHDNDTTAGWFSTLSREEKAAVLAKVKTDGREIHWDLIRLAMESRADLAVAPMQDLLGLGAEARMNLPGTAAGNWGWRLSAIPDADVAARFRELVRRGGRGRL